MALLASVAATSSATVSTIIEINSNGSEISATGWRWLILRVEFPPGGEGNLEVEIEVERAPGRTGIYLSGAPLTTDRVHESQGLVWWPGAGQRAEVRYENNDVERVFIPIPSSMPGSLKVVGVDGPGKMGRAEGEYFMALATDGGAGEFHGRVVSPEARIVGATAGNDVVFQRLSSFEEVYVQALAPGAHAAIAAEQAFFAETDVLGTFFAFPDSMMAPFVADISWAGPGGRGSACATMMDCLPWLPLSGPRGDYQFTVNYWGEAATLEDSVWTLVSHVRFPE